MTIDVIFFVSKLEGSMSKPWPALIIGGLVAVYWSRVLIMVRQSRAKSGHGANLIPPEPIGRLLRIIWMPVIALWNILPFAAFIARDPRRYPTILRPLFTPIPVPALIAWLAAAIATLCLLATFICWKRMGTNWRMGIDPDDCTQLVCTGPYAFVRHPIYGLSSLLMICTLLAVPNPLMIGAGVIHLLLLQWEARREERHMIQKHGEEYRRYSCRTGRFFPRFIRNPSRKR